MLQGLFGGVFEHGAVQGFGVRDDFMFESFGLGFTQYYGGISLRPCGQPLVATARRRVGGPERGSRTVGELPPGRCGRRVAFPDRAQHAAPQLRGLVARRVWSRSWQGCSPFHRVQPGDARDVLGQSRPARHPAGLVLQLDVVVLLAPVIPDVQLTRRQSRVSGDNRNPAYGRRRV